MPLGNVGDAGPRRRREIGDILPERSDYFFRLINVDFSPTPLYLAIKDNQAIIQKMWE